MTSRIYEIFLVAERLHSGYSFLPGLRNSFSDKTEASTLIGYKIINGDFIVRIEQVLFVCLPNYGCGPLTLE